MTSRLKFDLSLLILCAGALGWLLLSPGARARRALAAFHPTYIAHRGYSDRYPENTVASILEAVSHGARWIEVDVRMTADGRLVLHHDAALADVGLPLDVAHATLAQIKARPIAGSAQRIPTLDEVLGAMAKDRSKLYLHLKDSPLGADEAASIVAACRSRGFLGRLRFNSGSWPTLALLRALAPKAWLEYDLYDADGLLWPNRLNADDLVRLRNLAVRSIGTFGFKIDAALVRQAHQNGLLIDALVSAGAGPFFSEPSAYGAMAALGVDEIMTDHIARYLLK